MTREEVADIGKEHELFEKSESFTSLAEDSQVVMVFSFSGGVSIDLVSRDKHLFDEEESTDNGFELYVHNDDGTGGYEPLGWEINDLDEIKVLIEKHSNKIQEVTQ